MKTPHARRSPRASGNRGHHSPSRTRVNQASLESVEQWRRQSRMPALTHFARRTASLKWTRALFVLLLEELFIGDEFDAIIGDPETIAPARYPQAVALAIALRHSWRPDDLEEVGNRLGMFGHEPAFPAGPSSLPKARRRRNVR
jgi:hypothetical protein